jgi:hypothetical protein
VTGKVVEANLEEVARVEPGHSAALKTRKMAMRRRRQLAAIGGVFVFALVILAMWYFGGARDVSAEAPEAQDVMQSQANIPFQILIPAYMPRRFDRSKAEIKVTNSGPGGAPQAELSYYSGGGGAVFITEWLPGDPEGEMLFGSRPIQTKWGKGYLLTSGSGLIGLWVNIGPLRVQLFSNMNSGVSREDLLEMAQTLGPASNQQVFYYAPDKPVIKDMPLPPPEVIKINDQGVQEFTLVITPGGYNPIRFTVKKGVPVKMTFRMLGEVGCGNTLIFPTGKDTKEGAVLKSETDKAVIEFTPQETGNFQFYCGHFMFRGIMTVVE